MSALDSRAGTGPTDVVLGPAIDLHCGIHATFTAFPPQGFAFQVKDCVHNFFFPRGSGYAGIFDTLHWGEAVELPGEPVPLVHTARWPVLGARAWVTDMDDFAYPSMGGRSVISPSVRRQLARRFEDPGGPAPDHAIRVRLAHMLRAYAHSSCRAVLFLTQQGLAQAARFLRQFDAGADGDRFLAKCHVLGPALKPLSATEFDTKWSADGGTNVIFCGNDWRIKNGPLAVRIMARLALRYPTSRFIYVGRRPPEYEGSRQASLPRNLRLVGPAPHAHVLRLFEGAHILFHPALSESFGMVLLEAAACGLAVVCGGGKGMRHLSELLDARGAAILNRDLISERDEEAGFEVLLDSLLANHRRAHALGAWNRTSIENSAYSLHNRNRYLSKIYERAIEEAAPVGLRRDDLQMGRPFEVRRLASRQVVAAEREFRRRAGVDELSVRFPIRMPEHPGAAREPAPAPRLVAPT